MCGGTETHLLPNITQFSRCRRRCFASRRSLNKIFRITYQPTNIMNVLANAVTSETNDENEGKNESGSSCEPNTALFVFSRLSTVRRNTK